MGFDLRCGPHEGGCWLAVTARPGAKADAIAGLHDGALRVKVTAAPEKGKANKAILKLLADALAVRPADLQLLSGETNSEKKVFIRGLEPATLAARLAPCLAES